MFTKLLVAATTLMAMAKAGIIPAAAPLAFAPAPAPLAFAPAPAPLLKAEAYDPHPQYTYGYDVQDTLTGDSKSQYETRDGDVVSGSYSLIEPDGSRRVVEYTADPINGFNAVVHRQPAVTNAIVPVPAKVAAPFLAQPAFAYHH